MMHRRLPLVLAVMSVLVLGIVHREAVRLLEANRESSLREQITLQLSAIRARLELAINDAVNLTQGFDIALSMNKSLSDGDFTRIARYLIKDHQGIVNIALAPDNVVRQVYPRQGNEAVLGYAYLAHPEQRQSVLEAIRSRAVTVAGPLELVQGGQGIISRRPLFLEIDGKLHYWGLVSIVLDYHWLLARAGLANPKPGLVLAIRGKDALGPRGAVFFGPASAFDRLPIVQNVMLPQGSWQLAAYPKEGWQQASRLNPWLVGGGYFLCLLMGLMIYLALANYRKVATLARHDSLTGLPNRRLLFERFGQALLTNRRYGQQGAILLLDLDNFKPINDRLGHNVGDLVLKSVAERMVSTLRRSDTVSRMGGDEFLILLPTCLSAERGRAVAQKLIDCISVPMVYEGETLYLGASIGLCLFPQGDLSLKLINQCADVAMYQAKSQGGNQVVVAEQATIDWVASREAVQQAELASLKLD
ncbi:diguanylate cyclase domain-containing protein [Pseudaeromonas paramecii]|uniref:Diguanylate cyclase n=1 Tax=Pseudaeromonas paramecii TaxID=2138166 RepID=A0ABP8Q1V6_9GAMM